MALSQAFKNSKKPARLPIEIFVGGDGQSFQPNWQIKEGGTAVDLTGVTVRAEIRTLDDSLLAVMAGSVTVAAEGRIQVALTREAADAISWPEDGPLTGLRSIRARWHVALDDGVTVTPIVTGDVWASR
jgi:TRAP-type mannitol/chloroaromatic compound transport system substrate-binding protein